MLTFGFSNEIANSLFTLYPLNENDINSDVPLSFSLQDNTLEAVVSKTLVAYLSGGGEYGEVKLFNINKNKPFLGGGGAIVNFQPVGFLHVKNGKPNFIKIPIEPIEKMLDSALNLIGGNAYAQK